MIKSFNAKQLLDNVPAELSQINNWVLVKLLPRDDSGKDKVPVGVNKAGQVHNLKWGIQSNLMSFERARSHYQNEISLPESSRRFHGIGFVLSNSGFLCVDLDKSVDHDALKPFAEEVLGSLNGYVEFSQSKTGHHIIVSNKGWAGNTKRGKFEDGSGIDVLSDGSYVMITGYTCEFTQPLTNGEQDFSVVRKWQDRCVGSKAENKTSKSVPFDHSIPLPGWTADRIRTEIIGVTLALPFTINLKAAQKVWSYFTITVLKTREFTMEKRWMLYGDQPRLIQKGEIKRSDGSYFLRATLLVGQKKRS